MFRIALTALLLTGCARGGPGPSYLANLPSQDYYRERAIAATERHEQARQNYEDTENKIYGKAGYKLSDISNCRAQAVAATGNLYAQESVKQQCMLVLKYKREGR